MKNRQRNLEELHGGASQLLPSPSNGGWTQKVLNQNCNRSGYLGVSLYYHCCLLLLHLLSVLSLQVPMFSDNSHCPDCGQQWFPSLELGHWLYQTELVENECYQVFLDRINRADYCPECYPDNPANRSLVLPWSFHLSGLLKILPGGPLKKLATHFFWVLHWLEKEYMILELLVLTLHYS